jgi:hypothetical protein
LFTGEEEDSKDWNIWSSNVFDKAFCRGGEAKILPTVIESCGETWALKRVTA